MILSLRISLECVVIKNNGCSVGIIIVAAVHDKFSNFYKGQEKIHDIIWCNMAYKPYLRISLLILCAQSFAMNVWLCRDVLETGKAFCISA